MTKTSPAKPIPKPRQELIELPEDSGAIFQAVGILPGVVVFENPGTSITVEGKQYPLYYSTEHRSAWKALKLNVKATGPLQHLIVYPNAGLKRKLRANEGIISEKQTFHIEV